MTNNKQHLFLFTIGPVQSFIAQARKTQDLYAGSQILSKLIDVAIKEIKQEQLIFPQYTEGSSLPNHFLAVVDIPENELIKLGERVAIKVRQAWTKLVVEPVINLAIKESATQNITLDLKGINQQIHKHLEIYWLFELIKDNEYKAAYDTIKQNLEALKNVRPFEQFKYNNAIGERGRKCSLDGQRNIKFYRKSEGQKEDNSVIREKYLFNDDNLIFDYEIEDNELPRRHLQPGEGLSAVSFGKRFYQEKDEKGVEKTDFESTAEIALLDVISFWENNCSKELNAFQNSFKGKDFNAQLYFEDSFNENYFKKQGYSKNYFKKQGYNSELQDTIKALNNQRADLDRYAKENNYRLSKYYAVLTFDGDSMGEWLSGENLKEGEDLQHFQKEMSKLLSVFAQKAKDYLNDKNRGRSIYAGGDDFLGFVNLNHLFEVVSHLQKVFETDVCIPLSIYAKEGKQLTFSAGICIAHYKEPLSLVLSKAREMQKHAKEVPNKAAYGIGVIKASGEIEETIWRFGNDSLDKMKQLTEALRDEKVSNTFIKNFERSFIGTLKSDDDSVLSTDLLVCEFKRLITRLQEIEGGKMFKVIWDDFYQSSTHQSTLLNFFSALRIIDFLHRKLHPSSKSKNKEQYANA